MVQCLLKNNSLQEFFHVFSCEFQKNRKLIIFSAGWAKKEFHQAGFSQTNLFFCLASVYELAPMSLQSLVTRGCFLPESEEVESKVPTIRGSL